MSERKGEKIVMVDKIEEARRLYFELESKCHKPTETAKRNFEIQSRMAIEVEA